MSPAPLRFGPIARLAVGLAALALTLLLVGDFLFGLSNSDTQIVQQGRKRAAESLAVQATILIESANDVALGRTFSRMIATDPELRSLAVRRSDGSLLLERGNHPLHWGPRESGSVSSRDRISVPILDRRAVWGYLEMTYRETGDPALTSILSQPLFLTSLLISVGGSLLFYVYLRRAMHYLNPSHAIPERVHRAFDTLHDAVVILDLDARILLANVAFRRLNGQDRPLKIGTPLSDLAWLSNTPSPPGTPRVPWEHTLRTQEPLVDQHREVVGGDGQPLVLSLNCSPVRDEAGQMRGCLLSLTDQSQLEKTNVKLKQALGEIEASHAWIQAQNEKLQFLAARDPLTGCLNRRAFFEQAAPLFTSSLSSNGELSCIMSDIDHFKNFNDTYGHTVGDHVIKVVASNIERHLRQDDLLCRYGGEEFCIILAGVSADETFQIAERIRTSLATNGNKAVRSVDVRQITSSFGISHIIDGGATSLEQLIDQADMALYASKENGRNRTTRATPTRAGGTAGR